MLNYLDVRSCRFVIREQLLVYYSTSTSMQIIPGGIETFKNDKLYRITPVSETRGIIEFLTQDYLAPHQLRWRSCRHTYDAVAA